MYDLHEPLYPCGSGVPVVRYNAAWDRAKSTEKARFPQISSEIGHILPIFA